MKKVLLVFTLLASSSAFAATRFSIGIGVGPAYGYYAAPPPPPRVYYAPPPSPGPGFAWVSGYYYPVGRRYEWRQGYWTRPPRGYVRWVAPRYHQGRYYNGYWR